MIFLTPRELDHEPRHQKFLSILGPPIPKDPEPSNDDFGPEEF